MSLTLDINCGVLCRCCRKTSVSSRMFSLFDKFDEKARKLAVFKTIYDLFARYTLLEIDESDQSKAYICTQCYETLLNFHDFREKCIASHFEFLKQKNEEDPLTFKQETDEKPLQIVADEALQTGLCEIKNESFDHEEYEANEEDEGDDHDDNVSSSEGEEDNQQQTTSGNLLCSSCGKGYMEKNAYEKHLLTHISTLVLFPCGECGQEYTTRGNLKTHMTVKHPADEKVLDKLKCPICSKQCFYEQSLRFHMIRHEGRRDFVCTICGEKRTTKRELDRHVNQHTKEKEYPCDICSQKFYSESSSYRHKRTHFGTYKKKCNICGGLFSNLSAHLKQYASKPSKCKKYPNSIQIKSFKCDICDNAYARLDLVKAHIRRQHQKPKKKQN